MLRHFEKEKAKPKRHWLFYLCYIMLILTLIYIVDEIATNLPNSLKTEINLTINVIPWNDGLSNPYSLAAILQNVYHDGDIADIDKAVSTGLSKIGLIGTIANVMLIISMFYRPLADRYGRKIFLFINTLGMALSLLIFFTATNFVGYVFGFFFLRFFVTPDQQIVFIFELAPEKHRNAIFSSIKGIAELGLVAIAGLRQIFLTEETYYNYKYIFLTIAIAAAIISLLALLFARESDVFLDERISYLKMSEEEKAKLKAEKDSSKAQGGFIAALRYTFKDKQILWICIATAVAEICYSCCNDYSTVLTHGFLGVGGMSQADATNASFFFPLTCALVTFGYGFVSDWIGRKKTSIILLALSSAFFALECIGMYYGWPAWLIGLFLGVVLGADWGNGDVLSLMAGESCPTNLRASIMSAWSLFFGFGMVLSMGVTALVPYILPSTDYISLTYLCIVVPAWIISLVILMLKTKETKGAALSSKIGESAIE